MIGIKPFSGLARDAYNAPVSRINVWDGSVRSGKTINSIMRWARWVREDAPDGGLMIVSKTERTARQNIVDPIMDVFGRHARYSAGNHELTLFGRRHIIIGANDERAEGKIRGITLAGSLGDELTLWPESFMTMLLSRLSVEGAAFLGTTNPDSPAHWLKRRFLDRTDELDLTRWHFRLDDNPHLGAAFVEELKREYTGLWHKRFIEGLWAIAEGAVYDNLDPDRHQVAELPEKAAWTVAGVKFGTTNPAVFVALSADKTGRLIAHDEYRYDSRETGRQKTMKEYSDDFKGWAATLAKPPEKVYVDPTANAFILQLWRDGVQGVHPADSEVIDGIRETHSLLGLGALALHKGTTAAGWDEMASYSWDPDASKAGKDMPLKVADRFPDALRFGLRGTRQRWRKLMVGTIAA